MKNQLITNELNSNGSLVLNGRRINAAFSTRTIDCCARVVRGWVGGNAANFYFRPAPMVSYELELEYGDCGVVMSSHKMLTTCPRSGFAKVRSKARVCANGRGKNHPAADLRSPVAGIRSAAG